MYTHYSFAHVQGASRFFNFSFIQVMKNNASRAVEGQQVGVRQADRPAPTNEPAQPIEVLVLFCVQVSVWWLYFQAVLCICFLFCSAPSKLLFDRRFLFFSTLARSSLLKRTYQQLTVFRSSQIQSGFSWFEFSCPTLLELLPHFFCKCYLQLVTWAFPCLFTLIIMHCKLRVIVIYIRPIFKNIVLCGSILLCDEVYNCPCRNVRIGKKDR